MPFAAGKCGLINHAIYYIFPLFFLAPGRVARAFVRNKAPAAARRCGLCICQPAGSLAAALTILATRKEKRRTHPGRKGLEREKKGEGRKKEKK